MHTGTLLLLGFVAGATITIGLPVGRLRSFSPLLRAALSMLATGILLFLLVEILSDAGRETVSALDAPGSGGEGILLAVLLAVGLAVGLLGLVWFEQRVIRGDGQASGRRLSFMVATGIGLHNLSEGLAIGQTYAQGATGLTLVLIVGFALHNTTEGFGIVGPSLRSGERLPWRTLGLLGLIGGGPTFVGTLIGSLVSTPPLSVVVLAIAGGALLYVIKTLFIAAGHEKRQLPIMGAVVVGFMIGWGTSFAADQGLHGSAARHSLKPRQAVVRVVHPRGTASRRFL